ncbi:hypothetical protein EJB05_48296, partial [Eragrostis curvula]
MTCLPNFFRSNFPRAPSDFTRSHSPLAHSHQPTTIDPNRRTAASKPPRLPSDPSAAARNPTPPIPAGSPAALAPSARLISQPSSPPPTLQEPICPPPEKRHKVSSDKDGDQCHSDRHSFECASQIAPYKHDKSGGVEDEQGKDLIASVPSKRKRQRSLPIEAYTAQCAACNEWRLVPTKKKYEEIRECIKENPFTCEKAREWKPDVACHDPSEVSQDGSKLWAMDQHNIPQAPPGWERLIMIRREGCSKFADVYYTSPTGRKLRSTNEVASYLKENPEYEAQGVKLSQFSFKIPTPARLDNVRKSNWTSRNDVAHEGSTKPLPEEVQAVAGPVPPTHEDAGDNNQLVPYNEDPPELLQQ